MNCDRLDCKYLLEYVKRFNWHSCTFSCKKRKRFIHILGGQGLGISEAISCDIISHICRFRFPRFPMYASVLLFAISKTEDPKAVQQMHKDLMHIKAYLTRRIQFFLTGENEKIWLKFKDMSFDEYLLDLGMFQGLTPDNVEGARQRYINALRADIKGNGYGCV